jgi:hypothetical protein
MMRAHLLLLALGVGMWLLTVFLTAWRKRRQREATPDGGTQAPPVLPRARPLQPPLGVASRGLSVSAGRRVAPFASARARKGSLRELRRGIVFMTILGPCRSLERPDPPQ